MIKKPCFAVNVVKNFERMPDVVIGENENEEVALRMGETEVSESELKEIFPGEAEIGERSFTIDVLRDENGKPEVIIAEDEDEKVAFKVGEAIISEESVINALEKIHSTTIDEVIINECVSLDILVRTHTYIDMIIGETATHKAVIKLGRAQFCEDDLKKLKEGTGAGTKFVFRANPTIPSSLINQTLELPEGVTYTAGGREHTTISVHEMGLAYDGSTIYYPYEHYWTDINDRIIESDQDLTEYFTGDWAILFGDGNKIDLDSDPQNTINWNPVMSFVESEGSSEGYNVLGQSVNTFFRSNDEDFVTISFEYPSKMYYGSADGNKVLAYDGSQENPWVDDGYKTINMWDIPSQVFVSPYGSYELSNFLDDNTDGYWPMTWDDEMGVISSAAGYDMSDKEIDFVFGNYGTVYSGIKFDEDENIYYIDSDGNDVLAYDHENGWIDSFKEIIVSQLPEDIFKTEEEMNFYKDNTDGMPPIPDPKPVSLIYNWDDVIDPENNELGFNVYGKVYAFTFTSNYEDFNEIFVDNEGRMFYIDTEIDPDGSTYGKFEVYNPTDGWSLNREFQTIELEKVPEETFNEEWLAFFLDNTNGEDPTPEDPGEKYTLEWDNVIRAECDNPWFDRRGGSLDFNFTSNGEEFSGIAISSSGELSYLPVSGGSKCVYTNNSDMRWDILNPAYRTIEMDEPAEVIFGIGDWVEFLADNTNGIDPEPEEEEDPVPEIEEIIWDSEMVAHEEDPDNEGQYIWSVVPDGDMGDIINFFSFNSNGRDFIGMNVDFECQIYYITADNQFIHVYETTGGNNGWFDPEYRRIYTTESNKLHEGAWEDFFVANTDENE